MTEPIGSIPPPLPPGPAPQVPLAYGFADGRRAGNPAAVASLVLGIIGCVPFITGVLAIVLGIIGIRKTRNPMVGGKGLAIAGVVLGACSIVGWSFFAVLIGDAYTESKPARIVAEQFLRDVDSGNINSAMATSIGFTDAQLRTESAAMAALGPLQSLSISSFNLSIWNGQTRMQLGGAVTFKNGQKMCTFDLMKTSGNYKVTSYRIQ